VAAPADTVSSTDLLADLMDELHSEMRLNEKPQTPSEGNALLRRGMLWPANLQTALRTAQHKTGMSAALQTAREDRLGNAVSVNASVSTAIERENGEFQTQAIATQNVGV